MSEWSRRRVLHGALKGGTGVMALPFLHGNGEALAATRASIPVSAPRELRTSGLKSPLAVDRTPEFSWQFESVDGARPTDAVVELFRDGRSVWTDQWRPGTVPAVHYSGPVLDPQTRFHWVVTVTDASGHKSRSKDVYFETGLGEGLSRRAQWIGIPVTENLDKATPVQYLRRRFNLRGKVRSARLYVSSLGWNSVWLNGECVSGVSIAPRYTSYQERIPYETFDVTELLVQGENRLGIQVGEGRYRGRNGGTSARGSFGNQLAAIGLLDVELVDGSKLSITTDATWESGYGPLMTADPKEGVRIDTRIPGETWTKPGTSDWSPSAVVAIQAANGQLSATTVEPITVIEEFPAVSVTEVAGKLVLDFGQNMAGVMRLDATGEPGQSVEVGYSELLADDGLIKRGYVGGGVVNVPEARDIYILKGGNQSLTPPMTTRGFRYAEVSGLRRDQLRDVRALALATSLDYHGSFHCSHSGLNRLHENVRWSMRSNYTDAPTDCPTRERSGWTGDCQVFAPTAGLLADVRNFLSDWLRDVVIEQEDDGCVRDVAPFERHESDNPLIKVTPGKGSAGWADAIVMVPWTLYQLYGRTDVLAENWNAMAGWVEFCRRRARARHPDRTGVPKPYEDYLIDTGFHWGEWLEPGNQLGRTPEEVVKSLKRLSTHPDAEVATGYFAHASRLLSKTARVLGKDREAAEYDEVWRRARAAYQAEFLDVNGMPLGDRQAKFVRPLQFELVPEPARPRVAQRLAEMVRANGNHVGTGFLSTGFLLGLLSENGFDQVAFDVLAQEKAPSWLAMVNAGATTIWESFQGGASRNHYSLGSIARYMYEGLGGLQRTSPGWVTATIKPSLNPALPEVAASTRTPFGPIACTAKLESDTWRIDVTVPPGVNATLNLPAAGGRRREVPLVAGRSSWDIPVSPGSA